jgi:phage terminase large subunit-like protein
LRRAQWTGHHGRELYDALRWADVARSQPMFFQITTAGEDMYSVCREQRDYAMQVNSGRVQDDQFLGYVRTVPDGADPWAEESWHAANPSLGHTITVESFRRDADRARQTPTTIARFLRYRLNVWTTGDSPWIRPADWAACRTDNDVDDLLGRQCYAALDLSRTTDTTSLQLMFPDDDGDGCELLSFFWLPEAKAKQLDGVVPFLQWATEGHITLIPGEVVEYSWIESAFAELCQQYEILTLAYDPLYATDTTARMEEQTGVPRVAFKQSWMNFAGPAKEFERRIISRKIRHHGHPIMDWQIGNATIKSDANGNIRPMKPTANDNRKVDGVVAAVMAQALCIQPEPAPLTYYEEHEVEWA